jgi:hypothetical protein
MNARIVRLAALASVIVFATGCSDPRGDFAVAEQQNTAEAFEQFISKHSDDPLAAQARDRIESLRFEAALAANTRDALRRFLDEFPASAQRDRVQQLDAELAFEEAGRLNTPQGWQRLLEEFPNGEHRRQVVRKLQAAWSAPDWNQIEIKWNSNREGYYAEVGPDGGFKSMPEGSTLDVKLSSENSASTPVEIHATFVQFEPPTAFFKDEADRWVAWVTNSGTLVAVSRRDDVPVEPASIAEPKQHAVAQWRINSESAIAEQIESMQKDAAETPALIQLFGTLPTAEARQVLESLSMDSDADVASRARGALETWQRVDELVNAKNR